MNTYELTYEVRYTVVKAITADDSETADSEARAGIYADVDLSDGTVQDISLIGHEVFGCDTEKDERKDN